MRIKKIYLELLAIATLRGRRIKSLAKEQGLNLSEAFSLVRSKGSIEAARDELTKRRLLEELKKEIEKLNETVKHQRHRYDPEPPYGRSTSGSRLSS
jgi:hypothetical protein